MAKKETAVQSPVAAITAADKENAKILLKAGRAADKAASGFFGLVVTAITAGATFEGMESVCPELKDIVAYRSAKSTVRKSMKQGVKLLDGEGNPKSKKTLTKETGGKTGDEKKEPVTVGGKGLEASEIDVLQLAFAILRDKPAMRKAYRTEIMATARALANDEATSGTVAPKTQRVTPQRAKLANAAAKQEAEKIAA